MSFAAVGYLWSAVVGVGAVVALHLLARRRPRPAPLPTARFVPERAVRAPALNRRPSDLVLLALRAVALLLLGLALARPQWSERHASVGAVTIGDSVATFSGAFATAFHAAAELRESVDSIALTIALPLTRDRWDAATIAWRNAWPGAVKLVDAESRGRGNATVEWPAGPGGDSLRGLVLGDIVSIGRWGGTDHLAGVPVAFFNDGTAAASEVATQSGCTRHVAVGIPGGDGRLRPAFRRIESRLRSAPCGSLLADSTRLDSAQRTFLAGTGGPAAVSDLPPAHPPVNPSVALILLAAVLLGTEQVLRRRSP